jgi:putative transposase
VKKSANRKKAQKVLAKGYLKVQRQREDFARKQANALVSSHDLIAFENLTIRTMVRNRKLSKSIHDAGWGIFMQWLTYYGGIHAIPVIAVPPKYTSQDCSKCGTRVKKSLSVRTHICPSCGFIMDRDQNAALNILKKALFLPEHLSKARSDSFVGARKKESGCTVGHTETGGECHP